MVLFILDEVFSAGDKVVPEAGLEPARLVSRGILNPLCLPIPPLGHRVCYLKHVE